jgi:hypothetical protein
MIKEQIIIDGKQVFEKIHPGKLDKERRVTQHLAVGSNDGFFHFAHDQCFPCLQDSEIAHVYENMAADILQFGKPKIEQPTVTDVGKQKILEFAVIQAGLDLLGHMQAAGVMLSIPGTEPPLFVVVGSQLAILNLTNK